MRNKSRNGFQAPRRPRVEWLLLLVLTFAVALVSTPTAKGQKAAAPEGKSHYATLDGNRIHYQSYGKGREALVLIHGWTCNLDYWRDQGTALSKKNCGNSRELARDSPS